MRSAGSVDVLAGDLAAVVDRRRQGHGRAGHVDPPEPAALVEQEAVLGPLHGSTGVLGVRTDDAAPVVDPAGKRSLGAGEVDPAKAPPLTEESMDPLAGVEVGADDLSAAVAAEHRSDRCAGHVDLGEASGVAHEAVAA